MALSFDISTANAAKDILMMGALKFRLFAVIAFALFLGSSPASAVAARTSVSPGDLAMASNLPGKFVKGRCLPFARELYRRLDLVGQEAHLVIYSWKTSAGATGLHAVLVYRDRDGRYWAMDNEKPRPVLLRGQTALAWCRSFSPGTAVRVWLDQSNQVPVRRPAERKSRLVAALPESRRNEPRAVVDRPDSEQQMIAQLSAIPMQRPGYLGDGY